MYYSKDTRSEKADESLKLERVCSAAFMVPLSVSKVVGEIEERGRE